MKWLIRKGLRVLMYHKVSVQQSDYLTVTTIQLAEQLGYLQNEGYQWVRMADVIEAHCQHKSLPDRAVLLTFDDAYLNNLTLALPILKQYNAPATIFVPTGFIGQTSAWDANAEPLMSVEALRSLPQNLIELALHSHQHQSYGVLQSEAIRTDLSTCIQILERYELPFVRSLAYPFGSRPKQKTELLQMRQILAENGVELAFRIGNRINAWPLKEPTEINRIDVRGTDSFDTFKRKVRWGKIL